MGHPFCLGVGGRSGAAVALVLVIKQQVPFDFAQGRLSTACWNLLCSFHHFARDDNLVVM
jgi:hypothetical protein